MSGFDPLQWQHFLLSMGQGTNLRYLSGKTNDEQLRAFGEQRVTDEATRKKVMDELSSNKKKFDEVDIIEQRDE